MEEVLYTGLCPFSINRQSSNFILDLFPSINCSMTFKREREKEDTKLSHNECHDFCTEKKFK